MLLGREMEDGGVHRHITSGTHGPFQITCCPPDAPGGGKTDLDRSGDDCGGGDPAPSREHQSTIGRRT